MDVNCDLGEGLPNDEKLMAFIDSCSIACGGHAGDQQSMVKSLRLAKQYGVKAGAHPSFEDRQNFGRKEMKLSLGSLRSVLIKQIGKLNSLAESEGVRLHHVKAHGALYNLAARSEEVAEVLIEAVGFIQPELCIFVPYGSVMEKLAKKKGIPHWVEVFADRNYDQNMRLIARTDPHAIIEDPTLIKERVSRMISKKTLLTVDGAELKIDFDTVCVHGDHPRSLEILKELHAIKMKEL